jgi:hypothetical protein
MGTRDKVDAIIQKQGYGDYKWLDPAEIFVFQWVRMCIPRREKRDIPIRCYPIILRK